MQVASSTVPTPSEIEAIVRAVLQRLQAHELAPPLRGASPAAAASIPPANAKSAVVRLAQPLVTLEDLRNHWGGMLSLEVPPRCIITPAVHDELRRQGVKLLRIEPLADGSQPAHQPASKLLVLIPATGKSEVRSQLKPAEAQVAPLAHCNNAAMDALKNHLQDPQAFSIWSSPRPFAAMRACAALSSAAAVQLSRFEELPQAIEQAQPNLLILDDRRWTASGLAHLAQAWLRSDRTGHVPHRNAPR